MPLKSSRDIFFSCPFTTAVPAQCGAGFWTRATDIGPLVAAADVNKPGPRARPARRPRRSGR